MISAQAREGVDYLFTKAARANLVVNGEDCIDIQPLPRGKSYELPGSRIVVLTISSFTFRILTIFHVEPDGPTRNYFTRGQAERDFIEVFCELGNLCCGAMNRDLGPYFPHLGMSTPYVLDQACIPFLGELKPGAVSQHRLIINDRITLHATVCICSYAPLDFRVDTSHTEDTSGELELF